MHRVCKRGGDGRGGFRFISMFISVSATLCNFFLWGSLFFFSGSFQRKWRIFCFRQPREPLGAIVPFSLWHHVTGSSQDVLSGTPQRSDGVCVNEWSDATSAPAQWRLTFLRPLV